MSIKIRFFLLSISHCIRFYTWMSVILQYSGYQQFMEIKVFACQMPSFALRKMAFQVIKGIFSQCERSLSRILPGRNRQLCDGVIDTLGLLFGSQYQATPVVVFVSGSFVKVKLLRPVKQDGRIIGVKSAENELSPLCHDILEGVQVME